MTTIKYAKKFGFVSRSFFWWAFCTKSERTNYRYWSLITGCDAFVPYKGLEESDKCFYLNLKSKWCNRDGIKAVGRRYPDHFFHDTECMKMIFALESLGVVRKFWTEQELRFDRNLAWDVLGGDPEKLPDFVFELDAAGSIFRAAVEIEASQKSSKNYFRILTNYSRFRHISLIIYGTANARIEQAINKELDHGYWRELKEKTGFYSIQEFDQMRLNCKFSLAGKSPELGHFFKNLVALRSNSFAMERQKNGSPLPLQNQNFGNSK